MAQLANTSPHIVNATNMWKARSGQRCKLLLAQFAFFKYLAEDYNVVHVGMRSGMLESMALLGMTTFYLEGAGSGSGDRMLTLSRAGIRYACGSRTRRASPGVSETKNLQIRWKAFAARSIAWPTQT